MAWTSHCPDPTDEKVSVDSPQSEKRASPIFPQKVCEKIADGHALHHGEKKGPASPRQILIDRHLE